MLQAGDEPQRRHIVVLRLLQTLLERTVLEGLLAEMWRPFWSCTGPVLPYGRIAREEKADEPLLSVAADRSLLELDGVEVCAKVLGLVRQLLGFSLQESPPSDSDSQLLRAAILARIRLPQPIGVEKPKLRGNEVMRPLKRAMVVSAAPSLEPGCKGFDLAGIALRPWVTRDDCTKMTNAEAHVKIGLHVHCDCVVVAIEARAPEHWRLGSYPTVTGTSVIVSLPKMSMTLTATV